VFAAAQADKRKTKKKKTKKQKLKKCPAKPEKERQQSRKDP
jgi:hypothetical protein